MKFLSAAILLAFSGTKLFAHGISGADKQAMIAGGLTRYMELGAVHMLTGYDHLLFLFGVIFFLTNLKDILKFVTAFTLGHSITLIFATYLGITANYYLIDAVIALTVIYKGFDNVGGFRKYLEMESPNLLKLVFIFGLIHGFGLSTRLQQLPMGESGLLGRIIAFNIGVEVGQVIALLFMVALLTGWRKRPSFRHFSNASNVGLMLAGVYLFFMQMHGHTHQVFVDELAFSKDSHYHHHREAAVPGGGEMEATVKKQVAAPSGSHSHGGSTHSHGDAKPTPVPTKPSVHHHGDGKQHSH